MDLNEARGSQQAASGAADLVSEGTYRKLRIIGIAVAFVALGIAILVKYLVTGVIVRDWLGWAMLAVQVVLAIIFPFVLLRRKHS